MLVVAPPMEDDLQAKWPMFADMCSKLRIAIAINEGKLWIASVRCRSHKESTKYQILLPQCEGPLRSFKKIMKLVSIQNG